MRNVFNLLLAAGLILGTTLPPLGAQESAAELRQRMEHRLPAVDEMKSQKIVGENNRGFLEVRGDASGEQRETVDAENRDRTAVYAMIAEQTEATPEQVGRARARRIAELSAPGVLLQAEDGSWYEKR
jgi:uncharacterized protein